MLVYQCINPRHRRDELMASIELVDLRTGVNGGKMTMMTMFDGTAGAGDFGWDPMGLMSPANEERMKMRELQHGRLAMIAIGGMIHGSFVTGTGVFGGMNWTWEIDVRAAGRLKIWSIFRRPGHAGAHAREYKTPQNRGRRTRRSTGYIRAPRRTPSPTS